MTAKICRYPAGVLCADYLRGLVGLSLTGGPLLLLPTVPWVSGALGLGCGLFAAYLVRTALRHGTSLHVDDRALRVTGPFADRPRLAALTGHGNRTLPWSELRGLRLHYFSTRRDRSDGWLVLTLKGPDGSIRIDSALPGFAAILDRAVPAAHAAGVPIGTATEENLLALGRPVPGDRAADPARVP